MLDVGDLLAETCAEVHCNDKNIDGIDIDERVLWNQVIKVGKTKVGLGLWNPGGVFRDCRQTKYKTRDDNETQPRR